MDQIFLSLAQKVPSEDPRLLYPIVYLRCCAAPARVIEQFLHEQFSYCPLDGDKRYTNIMMINFTNLIYTTYMLRFKVL